jgi:LmbE family N-acetylglucosaminyl deacetylase
MVRSWNPHWAGAEPAVPRRLVVVSPHPDDEVFGAAGLMTWCHQRGTAVEIIAATDGEGSHRASATVTRSQLRLVRAHERRCALALLDLADVPVHRLGLADGSLGEVGEELTELIMSRVDCETTLVVPSRHDSHPDHHATYRAGLAVRDVLQCQLWEYAVWARLDPRELPQLGKTLHLGAGLHYRKLVASWCFRSQILAMGPNTSTDGPVLDAPTLAAFTSPTERVVMS